MPKAWNPQLYRFDLLDQYLTYLSAVHNKSPLTIKEYRLDIMSFMRFYLFKKDYLSKNVNIYEVDFSFIDESILSEVKLVDIYDYLADLNKKNSSSNTRARKCCALSRFFKFLVRKLKLLEEDPTAELEVPSRTRSLPVHLKLKEAFLVLDCLEREVNNNPIAMKYRDKAIIITFLNCGVRLSEMCLINLDDIKGTDLKVTGKGRKERMTYINPITEAAINDYLKRRHEMPVKKGSRALFISRQGNRIAHSTVQRLVKIYIEKAGLDPKIFSPHKLRHTCATLLYQYGQVDIRTLQGLLGHESIQTTQIYTHINDAQIKDAVNKNPLMTMRNDEIDPEEQEDSETDN